MINPCTSGKKSMANIGKTHLVGGLEQFIFFHILGIIILTDFHIFQRGRPTTNQQCFQRDPLVFPGPNPGLHRRRRRCAALSAAEPSRRDGGDASVPLSTVEIWGPSGCQETWQEDKHLLMGLNGNIIYH